MKTSVVFSVSDILVDIIEELSPVMTKERAEKANLLPLIEMAIDIYIHGYVLGSPQGPTAALMSLGLSQKDATRLSEHISYSVQVLLDRLLVNFRDTERSVNVIVAPNGEVELLIFEPNVTMKSDASRLEKEMSEAIENGDYYPERIRALHGSLKMIG
ncbi:MAG: hypothetical protein CL678_16055 [Bdellovibrionaceae bacterium]|nr:hypothetical protein [Pseudobdellovibrionaceae bacterium]|tara:strand:- start:3112 stop:3585 length:474 start_codon:yes stop_codon:yes gene_type:complete